MTQRRTVQNGSLAAPRIAEPHNMTAKPQPTTAPGRSGSTIPTMIGNARIQWNIGLTAPPVRNASAPYSAVDRTDSAMRMMRAPCGSARRKARIVTTMLPAHSIRTMSGPQLKCPSACTSLGANIRIRRAHAIRMRARAFDAVPSAARSARCAFDSCCEVLAAPGCEPMGCHSVTPWLPAGVDFGSTGSLDGRW